MGVDGEATGGNGLVTFGLGITTGMSSEGNGFGNFQAGNHYWDTLGRSREASDLVTFDLGITTGAAKGKLKGKPNGKLKGKAGGQHAWEAKRGNGRQLAW
mgnify:CR=1 FL=1